jgi:hypothetical protein
MMYLRMSSLLVTLAPGIDSWTTMGRMASVWKNDLERLKACTATSRSVGWERWFGLTRGRSRIELDVMLTYPRDSGDTGIVTMVPKRLLGSLPARDAALVSYSTCQRLSWNEMPSAVVLTSGQSAGNRARSARAETLRLLRYGSGTFSHPM